MTGSTTRHHLRRRVVWGTAVGALPAWWRALGVVLSVALSGCLGPLPVERRPVSAPVSGNVIKGLDAQGPAIECRGIARDRCLSAGTIDDGIAGIALTDIERVIVSCEGAPCTQVGGAIRVDVVRRDGTTAEVARGGYGDFRQP